MRGSNASMFKRLAAAENAMLSAVMPKTAVLDALAALATPKTATELLMVKSGVRLMRPMKLTFKLGEVMNAKN